MKKIGIKLADGSFYPILDEGTPKKRMLDLTTVKDNQTKVQIDLYRSELGSMEDAEYVDTLEVTNIVPHPNGEPELHLSVGLDDNNELTAEVIDPETGTKSETQVQLVSRTLAERDEPASFSLSEANQPSSDSDFSFDDFELPTDSETPDSLPADEKAEEPVLEETVEAKDPTDLDPVIPQEDGSDVPFSFDNELDASAVDEPVNQEEASVDSILDQLEETESEEPPVVEETVFDIPDTDNSLAEEPVLDEISVPVTEEEPAAEETVETTESTDDFSFDDIPVEEYKPEETAEVTTEETSEITEEPASSESTETVTEDFSTESLDDFAAEPALTDDFASETVTEDFTSEPAADDFASETVTEDFSTENVTDDFASETVTDDFISETVTTDTLDLPDFDNLETDFSPSDNVPDTTETFAETTDDFNSEDFTMPDFDDPSSSSMDTETAGLSGYFDDPAFNDPVFTEDNLESNSAASSMDFTDLYDDETIAGEHATAYNDEEEADDSKRKVSVIICIICAIICLLATILILFVFPSRFNILSKNKNSETTVETTVDKELPPPPVIEEPEPKPEPAPEAEEDKIVIAPEPEVVVPVPTPAPSEKKEDIRYKIRWGDTLWDIAETYYKNPWRYKNIANYNKIKNPDLIISGTYINIPSDN